MTRPTRGIPTTYKGTLFRSRLEARWAAMFDQLQWAWTYEPFDAAGYIPDFAILGDRPLLVEVKPHVTEAELEEHVDRVERATEGHWNHDLLIVGGRFAIAERSEWGDHPIAGILIERSEYEGKREDIPSLAIWCVCTCDRFAICSDENGYTNRPCGHYNGSQGDAPALGDLDHAWAKATNAVRWEPNRT